MTVVDEINTKNALRITNAWLSEVQYEAPYFGCGDMEAIKKALEKQMPKKPNKSGVTDKNGVFHATNGINGVPYDLCPNCAINLCTDGMLGRRKGGYNYCSKCGQKLDWEEGGTSE